HRRAAARARHRAMHLAGRAGSGPFPSTITSRGRRFIAARTHGGIRHKPKATDPGAFCAWEMRLAAPPDRLSGPAYSAGPPGSRDPRRARRHAACCLAPAMCSRGFTLVCALIVAGSARVASGFAVVLTNDAEHARITVADYPGQRDVVVVAWQDVP